MKKLLLILISCILLLTSTAFATDIYDKNWRLQYHVERSGNSWLVYDKNWNRLYEVKRNGDIYDSSLRLKYFLRGSDVYDKNWNRLYHIEGNRVYDTRHNLLYHIER